MDPNAPSFPGLTLPGARYETSAQINGSNPDNLPAQYNHDSQQQHPPPQRHIDQLSVKPEPGDSVGAFVVDDDFDSESLVEVYE